MAEKKYDLTSGGILKKLLLVAVPVMGIQFMQMTYNLVDMFYLGRLSSDAVAASSTAGTYMWLSSGLMLLGRMGAEIGVSQALGRRDVEDARRYARGALYIAAALGLVFAAILILFRRPLVGFFNLKEAHVAADAERYLSIVGVSVPFTYLSAVANGVFTASGNSRLPFLANGAGLVLNMVLDPVLIFSANMGVAGAAIATAGAQIFVALIALTALKRSKHRPFDTFAICRRPSFSHIRRMLVWSIPVSLESLFFTLLSMLTTRIVASYGANAIATVQVGNQIESLSWLVGGGYGSAVTAFIGQNFGARRQDRIDRCVRLSIGAMTLWGLFVSMVLFFAGGPLFMLFLPDETLRPLAVQYLRIMAFCEIFLCNESVGSAAFRGCGQTRQSAIASIASNCLRVVLAYALSATALGIYGVFWGITISTILRGCWIVLWYFRARPRFACGQAATLDVSA